MKIGLDHEPNLNPDVDLDLKPDQVIMKDKWMNMGYEEDDLKPYIEPVQDWNDRKRIEILEVRMFLFCFNY